MEQYSHIWAVPKKVFTHLIAHKKQLFQTTVRCEITCTCQTSWSLLGPHLFGAMVHMYQKAGVSESPTVDFQKITPIRAGVKRPALNEGYQGK